MKLVKWLAISLAVIIGLPVGALVAFGFVAYWSSHGTGIDGGIGSWAIRSLFHDGPRYFELTAKLEVEGEDVEFTRVVDCQPYFYHFDIHYFIKNWYMPNALMTHRLSDGSGVMLVIPDICERAWYPSTRDGSRQLVFKELPEDFVPLILWTPDAENPKVLEVYFSFASTFDPQARVRFKSISLENHPPLQAIQDSTQFLTLPRRPKLHEHRRVWPGVLLNYSGSYLVSIPRRDWSKAPELSQALEATATTGFLSPEVSRMIDRHGRVSRLLEPVGIGHAASLDLRRRSKYSPEPSPRSGFLFPIFDRLRGFAKTQKGFETAPRLNGVVTFVLATRDGESNTIPYRPLLSDINDRNIDWSREAQNRHYFDAESGAILALVKSNIHLSLNTNVQDVE